MHIGTWSLDQMGPLYPVPHDDTISNPPSSIFSAASSKSSSVSSTSTSPFPPSSGLCHSTATLAQSQTKLPPRIQHTYCDSNIGSGPLPVTANPFPFLPEGLQKCSFVDGLVGQFPPRPVNFSFSCLTKCSSFRFSRFDS
jgi:hypothetical protein